ncbi:toxin-antitoxin system HicB family antitoxin [Ferrimicrobium sp.]|uniref:FitA-like ribbon-helix-helix domain-containing protein n=1 Tax=Ferrimicrobium sp. TaxID=2926050 RepID=UPI002614069C|nr:toxin-antitoxin system HicB family antitoxin [Ferrimicrobium sp.]
MKQLLLRVPDDIHRRLTARAARAGRSVNAVANEILDAAVDANEGDRRTRLFARAMALGVLQTTHSPVVSTPRRHKILASTKGIGPVIDRLLAEDRERV